MEQNEIEFQIAQLQLILEKPEVYKIDYISKQLNLIFELLLKEYTPSSEIIKAIQFYEKWKIELNNEFDDFSKTMQRQIDYTNEILERVEKFNKEIKANTNAELNLPEERIEEDWKMFEKRSKLSNLMDKLPIAMNLYNFEKIATDEILKYQGKFYFSELKIDFFDKLFILTGIILSHIIGVIIENTIMLPSILVTILGALLCLITSDKYLSKFYEKFFIKTSKKTLTHIIESYITFSQFKVIFDQLIKNHPEVIS